MFFKSRIQQEKSTVNKMIALFCRKKHNISGICIECAEINTYAMHRLDKCQFGNKKPTCAKCPVHCYNPVMRVKMKQVMRFSGPHMLWNYPLLSIVHIYRGLR